MATRRVVCLANSRRTGGRCIAGKELINGQFARWVRPVSGWENGDSWNVNANTEMGANLNCLIL